MVVRRATMLGPLLLSTAGHALALFFLLFGAHLRWPAPPIPIEVRAADRAVERRARVEGRGDPKSKEKPRPPASKAPGEKAPQPPPPKALPPPETTDLSPFAPDDAHLVVLLRMDKLRRSPHRAGAEALL